MWASKKGLLYYASDSWLPPISCLLFPLLLFATPHNSWAFLKFSWIATISLTDNVVMGAFSPQVASTLTLSFGEARD